MKKKMFTVLAMTGIIMSCLSLAAYADEAESSVAAQSVEDAAEVPTDPYTGEPIEWDLHGTGEEDCIDEETQAAEIPNQEYSFSELADIKGMEQTTAAPHVSTQYVHISIPGYKDVLWSESNILVTLYRDGNHKEEVWLYRQLDFVTDVRLPVGHYTFGKAVAKDGTRLFTETNSFDLTTSEIGNLSLSFADTGVKEEEIDVEEPEELPEPPSFKETVMKWIVIAIVLTLAAVTMFMIIYVLRHDSEDKRRGYGNDLM